MSANEPTSVAPWVAFRIWLQHVLLGCAIFTPPALAGCCAVGALVRADHVGWALTVAVPSFLWDFAFLWWLTAARTWEPAGFAVSGWDWADGWTDAVCSIVGCCSFIPALRPWGHSHVCTPWCRWLDERREAKQAEASGTAGDERG